MKEMLKNKWIKCGLFFFILYSLMEFYSIVLDYFVMKNPNAYLDCGVRKYEYFERYEKRSNNFRIGTYSVNRCKGGKFLIKRYLALTDYYSGYIYRVQPLELSKNEMHIRSSEEDDVTIIIKFFRDPDGEKTTFCFYKPIPDVYRDNDKETKEEFIKKYNRRLENLDKKECF